MEGRTLQRDTVRGRFPVQALGFAARGLEHSNSTSTKMGGGMTTARWEINDPLDSVDFLLVTDTSIPAGSAGLGTGAIAGMLIGATIVATLGGFWLSGRRAVVLIAGLVRIPPHDRSSPVARRPPGGPVSDP